MSQKYIFRQTLTPIGRKNSEKDIKEVISAKFLYKKFFFEKNRKKKFFDFRPKADELFQKIGFEKRKNALKNFLRMWIQNVV